MAKKIGIISIKGGVGKTTIVNSLGAVLAKEFGKKVLLVDANFSAPNLGLHLGLINPKISIHDVLNSKVQIENSIYKTEHGFDLLPGKIINEDIDPFRLKNKLKKLDKFYDVIIIDSSPNLNNEILATMTASDELYAVTTPDHVTLALTMNAIKIAKEKGTKIKGIILNKIHNKNFELNINEIEETSKCCVLGVLPQEVSVLKSLSEFKPSSLNGSVELMLEFKKLAGVMIGEKYKGKGFKEKFKNLIGKYSRQNINREIINEGGKWDY